MIRYRAFCIVLKFITLRGVPSKREGKEYGFKEKKNHVPTSAILDKHPNAYL